MEGACPNCGTQRVGRWCHACGQKRIEPEERRLRWLVGQFTATLTDLDSRFLRSLRAMLLRPGLLGAEWLAGRRSRWSSPITLFLVINVAYFFAPQLTDLSLPLNDQYMQWYGGHARALIEERLQSRGVDHADYASAFKLQSGNLAKTLVILHVPPFALLLMLAVGRRDIPYVDHFSVATPVWATWLLAMLVIPGLLSLTSWVGAQFGATGSDALWVAALQLSLLGIMLFQILGILRRAYVLPAWRAWLIAPVLFVAGMVIHFGYRALLFYLTFALT